MLSLTDPSDCLARIRDSDEPPAMRLAALQFLAAVDPIDLPPGCLPAVLALLEDGDERIREAVMLFLEHLEPAAIVQRVIVAVVRRIEDPDEHPVVKVAAARVVGKIEPEELDTALASDRSESGEPSAGFLRARAASLTIVGAASAARISERAAQVRARISDIGLGRRLRRAAPFDDAASPVDPDGVNSPSPTVDVAPPSMLPKAARAASASKRILGRAASVASTTASRAAAAIAARRSSSIGGPPAHSAAAIATPPSVPPPAPRADGSDAMETPRADGSDAMETPQPSARSAGHGRGRAAGGASAPLDNAEARGRAAELALESSSDDDLDRPPILAPDI